ENAVDNAEGIAALEELLQTDRSLAELFGGVASGRVAAPIAKNGSGHLMPGKPKPFRGFEFPSFVNRGDGSTSAVIDARQGETTKVSFRTDVKNNYFSRPKYRGRCDFAGDFTATYHLFNGRLTFSCNVDKQVAIGATLKTIGTIT